MARACAGVVQPPGGLVTQEDLERAASALSVELRENSVGPFYSMELYSKDRQLGKTSGWAQPWGCMHLESIEVRKFTGYWKTGKADPEADDDGQAYRDVAKVARWFGLLLSVSIGVWNKERSPFYCREARLLAIQDEEKQHERLVRYYRSLGFKTLREPDELTWDDKAVWGGEGTLMNIMADDFMTKWTPIVRQIAARQDAK